MSEIPLTSSLSLSRDFRWFWCARVMAMMAFQMIAVGVGWQVYDLTHRALDLGLVGLMAFLPMVLLVLVTGQVVDRYNRRHIARLCQAVDAAVVTVLAVGSWQGWLTRDTIFVLVFLLGAAKAFEAPAMAALLPSLVTKEALPRAVSLSSSAMQLAIILGPALGGVIYAAGPEWLYGLGAMLFAGVSMCVSATRPVAVSSPAQDGRSLRSLFAGFAYIRRQSVLLGAISLDLFAVLLGGATALLPIYARDILHTGPWGLGLLRALPAIGALALSVVMAHFHIHRQAGRIMFAAVAVYGLGTIAFALSTSFALSLCALFVLGAADMISVVIRATIVQTETPDAMRGRVNAVNFLFIGTSNQLGEFESGITAACLGVVPAAALGGVGTLLVVALWMRWFPALRQRDRLIESASDNR